MVLAMPTTTARRSLSSSVSPTFSGTGLPAGSFDGRASLSRAPSMSTMTESARRKSSSRPSSMTGGPPMRVASSRPITLQVWKVPSASRALIIPLYMGIAQSTPLTPRTRNSLVSCSGLMSSTNCTLGSITQISGRPTSVTKLYERIINPTKMAGCCVMISEAKVSPMTMPRYLPRSPMSIFKAM